MRQLRRAIQQNQSRLEHHLQWLKKHREGFFSTPERCAACDRASSLVMAVIVCGKAADSLIASLEFDLRLYSDTRFRHTSARDSSVEIVPYAGGVIASRGSPDGALRIDDRIVAAKQSLLSKLNEYNNMVQAYRGNNDFTSFLGWGSPAEFVSIDSM